jgi:hypothetical protein
MKEIARIQNINKELLDWYLSLENRDKYTNPYLIMPDESYFKSKIKIVTLGKETNGWGEYESYTTQEELESLYVDKIIQKNFRECNFPYWKFCFNNLMSCLPENTGLCFANVALLGYRYGNKGYDTKLAPELGIFLKKYLDILSPDIIICLTGFGTKNGSLNYSRILENIFGTYHPENNIPMYDGKHPLYKLSFASNANIYGTRHPQGTSNKWRENFSKYIIDIINTL